MTRCQDNVTGWCTCVLHMWHDASVLAALKTWALSHLMQQAATVVICLKDCWKWCKTPITHAHTHTHTHTCTHMHTHTHTLIHLLNSFIISLLYELFKYCFIQNIYFLIDTKKKWHQHFQLEKNNLRIIILRLQTALIFFRTMC